MRERAQQSWPALPNTAGGAAAAAAARSASAKTTLADLPPSSRVTRLMVPAAPAMMPRPTSVEPVKAILATCGCSTRRRPTTRPGPASTLTTPGGMPASSARSLEGQGGQRRQPGRLEDHGVAGGQGGGELPGGDGEGEVPGHDQPHHPERLPEGQVDPAGHRDGVAEQPLGRAGVVGEGVDHHAQLAPGVADRLAGVAHLQLGQALPLGVEAFGQPAQQPGPVGRGDRPPALERGRGPSDGGVGVGLGGSLQPLDHGLGGRVADLEQGHSRSKPRNRSQSVTAVSNASSSTVAMLV